MSISLMTDVWRLPLQASRKMVLRKKPSSRSKDFYQNKYKTNIAFRDKEKNRINSYISMKYHTSLNTREKIKSQSKTITLTNIAIIQIFEIRLKRNRKLLF